MSTRILTQTYLSLAGARWSRPSLPSWQVAARRPAAFPYYSRHICIHGVSRNTTLLCEEGARAAGMDGIIMRVQLQRRFRDLLKLTRFFLDPTSTPFKEYCASLGHKVCHSFSPNAVYSHAAHPLFGRIR